MICPATVTSESIMVYHHLITRNIKQLLPWFKKVLSPHCHHVPDPLGRAALPYQSFWLLHLIHKAGQLAEDSELRDWENTKIGTDFQFLFYELR